MQGKIRSYWERKKIQITPSQFAWGIVAFSILAVVSRNLLKYGVGHSKLRDVCLMLILLIVLSASKKNTQINRIAICGADFIVHSNWIQFWCHF